eukprot:NODE_1815_length_2368_cov_6.269523.p2 GENE.NODE_1815_length_2368_cov_6.269523~~NODE_1815_length_2368_cov_6.269523.p2  ORF type:complete len:193 (+),score=24.57 NODE_1815_length_2368_cov_6.269523:1277-1855(+)
MIGSRSCRPSLDARSDSTSRRSEEISELDETGPCRIMDGLQGESSWCSSKVESSFDELPPPTMAALRCGPIGDILLAGTGGTVRGQRRTCRAGGVRKGGVPAIHGRTRRVDVAALRTVCGHHSPGLTGPSTIAMMQTHAELTNPRGQFQTPSRGVTPAFAALSARSPSPKGMNRSGGVGGGILCVGSVEPVP